MAETCDVPCRVVLEKLDGLAKEKVPMKVFMWVIGGIGGIGIVLVMLLFQGQSGMAQSLASIQSEIKVVQTEVSHLKNDFRGMDRQLRKMNGGNN